MSSARAQRLTSSLFLEMMSNYLCAPIYQDVTGYYAFFTADNLRLSGHGDPQPTTGLMVIGNFFQVLGVQPALGRLFTPDELRHGARPVAVLSHPYWRRQFASDPSIVGKAIDLNGQSTTVVGVLPSGFDFGAVFSPGAKADLFQPLILEDARPWGGIVTMLGRLKPGVTLAQAQAEGTTVENHLCWRDDIAASCSLYSQDIYRMRLRTLKDYVDRRLRRSLIVLWSAIGMILLIAYVNLSNLPGPLRLSWPALCSSMIHRRLAEWSRMLSLELASSERALSSKILGISAGCGNHLVLGCNRRAGRTRGPASFSAAGNCGPAREHRAAPARLSPLPRAAPEPEPVETTYELNMISRAPDEAHIRTLLLTTISQSTVGLQAIRSGDIEGTDRTTVRAEVITSGPKHEVVEQIVTRLSFEPGIAAVSWSVVPTMME